METQKESYLYSGQVRCRYKDRAILRLYRPHLAVRGIQDPDHLPLWQSRDLLAFLKGDSQSIVSLAKLIGQDLAEDLVICVVPPVNRGESGDNLKALVSQLCKGKRDDGSDCLERVKKPDIYLTDSVQRMKSHYQSIQLRNLSLIAGRKVLLLQNIEVSLEDYTVCHERLLWAGASQVEGLILGRVEPLPYESRTGFRLSPLQKLCSLQGDIITVRTVGRDAFTFLYHGKIRTRPRSAIGKTLFPIYPQAVRPQKASKTVNRKTQNMRSEQKKIQKWQKEKKTKYIPWWKSPVTEEGRSETKNRTISKDPTKIIENTQNRRSADVETPPKPAGLTENRSQVNNKQTPMATSNYIRLDPRPEPRLMSGSLTRRHPKPYWNPEIKEWPKNMTGPYGGGKRRKD